MNAIFFGEELNARAPNVVGALCRDDGYWIGFPDVLQAMRNGEIVTIRPATEAEYKRAAALVEIHDLGMRIAEMQAEIFGNQGPEVIEEAIFQLHQAIMSAPFPDVAMIDQAEV
jgi:hypothetical protein